MEHIHGSHDPVLIAFSYMVAVAASYTALDVTSRILTANGVRKWIWLIFGSVAMGVGIWSMHFVAMLAYTLPVPVAYDIRLVTLSVAPSIAGSFIALYILGNSSRLGLRQLLGGGLLLAAGVSSMHYIGMAAMEIGISYDPYIFTLSILIAIVASIAALWLSFYFRKDDHSGLGWKKLGSGLIMGAAIAGLHYTGMSAASFYIIHGLDGPTGVVLNQKWLAYLISGGTLLSLGLSLLGIFIARRLSHKDSEIQLKTDENDRIHQELLQLNEHLEELVKERTAQLEKAHDEAIQANRIKSQFLANMSHELRTPLNAIIGYSEMLQEEAEELGEATFVDDLGKISQAGNHLLSLINDILDISKIESGKMEVYVETCGLAGLVQEVVDTVTPLVDKNHNKLEFECIDGEITTDVTKLRQILINLLSNASKFTMTGTISFVVSRQLQDGLWGYEFRVKDTGIGMTAEQIDRLFEPFTQADSSTTRKYGGTGLGLAISQRFCSLLGGSIKVESSLGAGSEFICWLPSVLLQEEQDSAAHVHQEERVDDQQAISVLLIDDEPLNRQLMERYLMKENWTLALAENGQQGIAMAKKLRPKVICLDILMPGMDGWSVLSQLKQDPEVADIPVVIWSMTSDKQLGFTLGAAEFLMKPIQREQVIKVINTYVVNQMEQSILVIEDESFASDLISRQLRKEGYSVNEARNGAIALTCIVLQTPKLIVLDLMMPEMDGFQFIEQLRKHEAWRTIPIVVLTAKSITLEERQRLNGSVRNVIQKGSYHPQALLAELRPYLV